MSFEQDNSCVEGKVLRCGLVNCGRTNFCHVVIEGYSKVYEINFTNDPNASMIKVGDQISFELDWQGNVVIDTVLNFTLSELVKAQSAS